jgi:CheY-like chemotaxis protein
MAKRILIVEDEAIVAEIAALMLEDAGYEVVGIYATAERAIAQLKSDAPDLALLDINLGAGASGIDVARTIVDEYGMPFVFVTAQADAATRERAMATGPAGYLMKPYQPSELLAAVATALRIPG